MCDAGQQTPDARKSIPYPLPGGGHSKVATMIVPTLQLCNMLG